jgi:hypothetical protein
MDELDCHRPFADGGGAALDRAGADVAGREDTRDVGLEQVVGSGCCADPCASLEIQGVSRRRGWVRTQPAAPPRSSRVSQ